jgi:hypothetical protein
MPAHEHHRRSRVAGTVRTLWARPIARFAGAYPRGKSDEVAARLGDEGRDGGFVFGGLASPPPDGRRAWYPAAPRRHDESTLMSSGFSGAHRRHFTGR